jgi:hypothetical protein
VGEGRRESGSGLCVDEGRVADGCIWSVCEGRGRVVPCSPIGTPPVPSVPSVPSHQSPLVTPSTQSPISPQSPESLRYPQFPDSPPSHVSPESTIQSACGQYCEVRLIIRRCTNNMLAYHMWGEKSDETDRQTDRQTARLSLSISASLAGWYLLAPRAKLRRKAVARYATPSTASLQQPIG